MNTGTITDRRKLGRCSSLKAPPSGFFDLSVGRVVLTSQNRIPESRTQANEYCIDSNSRPPSPPCMKKRSNRHNKVHKATNS